MARIVFTSAGYWGDVMPFVPVANELAARGHEVVYAVPRGMHELLAGERFRLAHVGTDFSPRDLASDPRHRDLVQRNPFGVGGARLARAARHLRRVGGTCSED